MPGSSQVRRTMLAKNSTAQISEMIARIVSACSTAFTSV